MKDEPEYLSALKEFDKEYETVIDILSDSGKDIVIDILKNTCNGECPITFGETRCKEDGQEEAIETVMTSKEDWGTK